MQGIRNVLAEAIENRIGDSRSKSSLVRCVIYTGKMLTSHNTVELCPGYDKLTTSVWVVPKDRFIAFTKGLWRPENLEVEISRIKTRIGQPSHQKLIDEHRTRSHDRYIDSDPEIGVSPGDNTAAGISNNMWMELAFYELEVKKIELSPGEEKRIPGGIISPNTCEVQVVINGSAKFEPAGAKLILNPLIDRSILNQVPRGGGIKVGDYNRRISFSNNGLSTSQRVSRVISDISSKYQSRCATDDIEVSLEADIWYEGVRSSITRGLFEVWTDDLRMGPMLRVSRDRVYEASARYHRNTAAAEQRYATERDHPASADIPSSGLTPITVYIDDWFGDPNLYFGLAQFLLNLGRGFDNDSFEFNERFIDLGVFDYGKIYNQYAGVQV